MWSSIFAYFERITFKFVDFAYFKAFFFQQSQWTFANWSLLNLKRKNRGSSCCCRCFRRRGRRGWLSSKVTPTPILPLIKTSIRF